MTAPHHQESDPIDRWHDSDAELKGLSYYDLFLSSYSIIASARGRSKPLFGEPHTPIFVDDQAEYGSELNHAVSFYPQWH